MKRNINKQSFIKTVFCTLMLVIVASACQETSTNPIEIVPTGFFKANVVTIVTDDDVILPNYSIQILDGQVDEEGNVIPKLSTSFVADTSSAIPRNDDNRLVASSGTYTTDSPRFAGITPLGQYEVLLFLPDSTGGINSVPVNCEVDGDNPQIVEIPEHDTATVNFSVSCAAP